VQFARFFSLESPKAIKARSYGYLNAINYMAPASTGGAGNLCPHASAGCLALCLGWYSGQAAMLSNAELETGSNSVRRSRVAKAQLFMRDRKAFVAELIAGIKTAERAAARQGLKLCVRLNGATDINWPRAIFDQFPHVQFVDYTKSVSKALEHARGQLAPNYHVTFSRSETNEADCLRVLEAGGNVAVVFAGAMPATYLGHVVINGDEHDLRHLDNRTATRGACVVGLSPKGLKAKHDTSGFVVRQAMKQRLKPTPRNPIARDLRSPKYRPRVVKSQKIYSRKKKVETA
jgi:hypothetical protein